MSAEIWHWPVAIGEVIHIGRDKLINLAQTAMKEQDLELSQWGKGGEYILSWTGLWLVTLFFGDIYRQCIIYQFLNIVTDALYKRIHSTKF